MAMSMTGYGKGECSSNGYKVTVEIKGFNHRYFDLSLRASRRYLAIEDRIREKLKGCVFRGRIEVNLNIEQTGEQSRNIKVDKDLAIAYYKSLKELAQNLGISSNFGILDLFRLPEVFALEETEENLDDIWAVVDKAMESAVADFVQMRVREGHNLTQDILDRDRIIMGYVDEIEERSPQVVSEYAERLKKRLGELLSEVPVDEMRLAQEVAILADKACINEEIVRLRSHSMQLKELLASDQPVGRKCDFLIQEMFREINTIGSKANDLRIAQLTVEVKAELEKIREQVQNIE